MEIVLNATVIFFFLWALTRALGKRELAQMSAFELILLVTMGDLVQQGVTQEDFTLTGAVLAAGTIGLLILAFSFVSFRWGRVRPALEGRALVVVRDGRLLDDVIHLERVTTAEVMEAARNKGIADLATVRVGILEPDGSYSFVGPETDAPATDRRWSGAP